MTETEKIEKECAEGCGTIVTIDAPESPEGKAIFERYKDAPLLCDECAAKRDAEEEDELRAERARERHEARVAASRLPEGLVGLTWDQVKVDNGNREAVKLAKAWGAGEINGLVLLGAVGRGKTYLSAAATWERLQRERVRWYSLAALLAHAIGDFNSPERKEAAGVLTGTSTVVLDDVDKIKLTDWAAAQVFVAIDGRVQSKGGVLVTSNLTPQEISERFGDHIASRLFGYCEAVEITGKDRRL